MNIAVIGASGDIGRVVILSLIQRRILGPSDRLQLVGRSEGPSFRTLYGLKSDILDGLMESAPHMEVILSPSEVDAEIVVMAAGVSFPKESEKRLSRESLQKTNVKICRLYASAIAKTGRSPLFLITTHPVEAGVKVFSRYFPGNRVIGMGSHMDSMRFRREIGEAIGIDRSRIKGMVIGEHGPEMIPLWSSVRIEGMDAKELKEKYGKKIVLWGGGIDAQHVLPFAKTSEVKAAVKKNLEIFKPAGGYVFNNVHNVQAGVPAENIVALFDAAYEYGFYK